jgi:hypothetical protein
VITSINLVGSEICGVNTKAIIIIAFTHLKTEILN